ncbi:MAG: NADP-specific glutamate dehydrogenase [Flavobacteriales bacterium]
MRERDPHEPDFLQAVQEVAETILPFIEENAEYKRKRVLERMIEPERVIIFRVPWVDDNGHVHVNRGYRIQMNSAIGPYKGGLRFHPSVNLSVLKFLAFEQIFKNSLTTLPVGAGKGGSDFDPKGRSDLEVMRFCHSFMNELNRHMGPNTDVPAGDIGVGPREIGYLFGQYKKLTNKFTGVMTGKGIEFGGSLMRPEATGFGCVYFAEQMLQRVGESIKEKKVMISGSGNVAQFATEKCIDLGAKVITLSDSSGSIHDKDGITKEKIDYVKDLKNIKRGRIKEYADKMGAEYYDEIWPWSIKPNEKVDIVLPCATQNELHKEDAETLMELGVNYVAEGANMPCTPNAISKFDEGNVIFGPGKAANAGGVAVSALEMSQNSMGYNWSAEDIDIKLKSIMKHIHDSCVKYGQQDGGKVDYAKGANIAGFVKVANAMLGQGIV